MKACFFVGNSNLNYLPYREGLKVMIFNLVELDGVERFYSTGRSSFERLCAELVDEVRREQQLSVRNTLVQVYRRDRKKELPKHYDNSVYLLKRRVPRRYLFLKINKEIVKRSEVIFSGVFFPFDSVPMQALQYAKQQKKSFVKLPLETDEELEQSKRAVYFKLFGKELIK